MKTLNSRGVLLVLNHKKMQKASRGALVFFALSLYFLAIPSLVLAAMRNILTS